MANKQTVATIVPNWNGKNVIDKCLSSLLEQSYPTTVVVVDNGSVDGSAQHIKNNYPRVVVIEHKVNKGFAGGVNAGIRWAMNGDFDYVALFNNDAVAHKNWLKHQMATATKSSIIGVCTPKMLLNDKVRIDGTGDNYTSWGLAYPRGRQELDAGQYDNKLEVFGASGGASLYRIKMLEEIGLFDEDFFAYYEDVDLSFRAQLAGWKVAYVPSAEAYHQVGATSSRIKGFTTYQTLKNLPWLMWKNVPGRLLIIVLPRFMLAYISFFVSAVMRGHAWAAVKGVFVSLLLLPKKLIERHAIQHNRKVPIAYIKSIMTWGLPPNARRLRVLRRMWQKIVSWRRAI